MEKNLPPLVHSSTLKISLKLYNKAFMSCHLINNAWNSRTKLRCLSQNHVKDLYFFAIWFVSVSFWQKHYEVSILHFLRLENIYWCATFTQFTASITKWKHICKTLNISFVQKVRNLRIHSFWGWKFKINDKTNPKFAKFKNPELFSRKRQIMEFWEIL